MWALGKLGVEVIPKLPGVMQTRAIKIAAMFDSRGLANLMLGLATLEVKVNPFFFFITHEPRVERYTSP